MANANIVFVPTIADRKVEIVIRAEGDCAAIVIEVWVIVVQQHLLRSRVDSIRIAGRELEFGEPIGMIPILGRIRPQWNAVVHEYAAIAAEAWVEGQAEQAALI